VEEGRSVVTPAAALRPSAERKGLRPGCFPGPSAQAVMGAGLWPLDWWVVEDGDSGLRQSGTPPSASARTDGAPGAIGYVLGIC
jgi:hypothetical protein